MRVPRCELHGFQLLTSLPRGPCCLKEPDPLSAVLRLAHPDPARPDHAYRLRVGDACRTCVHRNLATVEISRLRATVETVCQHETYSWAIAYSER